MRLHLVGQPRQRLLAGAGDDVGRRAGCPLVAVVVPHVPHRVGAAAGDPDPEQARLARRLVDEAGDVDRRRLGAGASLSRVSRVRASGRSVQASRDVPSGAVPLRSSLAPEPPTDRLGIVGGDEVRERRGDGRFVDHPCGPKRSDEAWCIEHVFDIDQVCSPPPSRSACVASAQCADLGREVARVAADGPRRRRSRWQARPRRWPMPPRVSSRWPVRGGRGSRPGSRGRASNGAPGRFQRLRRRDGRRRDVSGHRGMTEGLAGRRAALGAALGERFPGIRDLVLSGEALRRPDPPPPKHILEPGPRRRAPPTWCWGMSPVPSANVGPSRRRSGRSTRRRSDVRRPCTPTRRPSHRARAQQGGLTSGRRHLVRLPGPLASQARAPCTSRPDGTIGGGSSSRPPPVERSQDDGQTDERDDVPDHDDPLPIARPPTGGPRMRCSPE